MVRVDEVVLPGKTNAESMGAETSWSLRIYTNFMDISLHGERMTAAHLSREPSFVILYIVREGQADDFADGAVDLGTCRGWRVGMGEEKSLRWVAK